MWKGSEAGDPHFIIGHVSSATRVHRPLVLQASIHHMRVGVGVVLWRFAHKAQSSEVVFLSLDLLIHFWVGGVFTQEVEIARGSTRLRHDLLELLLVSEAVFLFLIALVAGVVPVDLVVLVGRVELLPLGAIDDEVSGVAALEAAPGRSPSLLAELVQDTKLPY
jgi:hypothetical protein